MKTPLDILSSVYGHAEFRPYQAEIIDHAAGGGDTLLVMPTGGGKSLCYQIPALMRDGVGVVVSPLIALMQDQVDALTQLGVRTAALNSTLPLDEAHRVETAMRRGILDLVYVAPERLLQERTLDLLDAVAAGPGLAILAIDEAHCVSQWGHDFRPEYLQLDILAERFPGVPRLACTATADARTRAEIRDKLRLGDGRIFVTGFDRPNIRYRVVPKSDPIRQLLAFLRAEHEGDAGIVYRLSRNQTEKTAAALVAAGIDALPYHAGLPKAVRAENQARFQRGDDVVMVATIAFGMGIDKPDVRFVAHLDLPKSLEAYYQETGRAGRDGLPADAWMTYGLQDVILLRKMAESSEADEMHKRREQQALDAMLGYCEVIDCRRRVLLAHFGETLAEPCGNCDTCLEPVDVFDGTVAAQKALSCVARTGQRFGAQHVIDVLRGSGNERVRRWGHDKLSTHGIGTDLEPFAWRSVMRQLVARGVLALDPEGFGGLRLTEAARPILQGDEIVELRRDTLVRASGKGAAKARRRAELALTAVDGDLDDPETAALYDRLRALRRELAADQGVPPYVIFHDKALAAMAVHRPTSDEAFLAIGGVGESKLGRYGEAFMGVIREVE